MTLLTVVRDEVITLLNENDIDVQQTHCTDLCLHYLLMYERYVTAEKYKNCADLRKVSDDCELLLINIENEICI